MPHRPPQSEVRAGSGQGALSPGGSAHWEPQTTPARPSPGTQREDRRESRDTLRGAGGRQGRQEAPSDGDQRTGGAQRSPCLAASSRPPLSSRSAEHRLDKATCTWRSPCQVGRDSWGTWEEPSGSPRPAQSFPCSLPQSTRCPRLPLGTRETRRRSHWLSGAGCRARRTWGTITCDVSCCRTRVFVRSG